MRQKEIVVSVVVGSENDWKVMDKCIEVLEENKIPYEKVVRSAHRNPDKTIEYAKKLEKRGIKIVIAGAGMAAHLPAVIASNTKIPVIGVPIPSGYLQGVDSLLSIVQMPSGVPVATMAIGEGGAKNAGIFAGKILKLIEK